MEKYLFLYLKTGGGHMSSAKSVAKKIENDYQGKVEIVLADGFENVHRFFSTIVVDGYSVMQSKYKWLYAILYFFNMFPLFYMISVWETHLITRRQIKKLIEKEKPDKIVSFHFFLVKPSITAVKSLKLNTPVMTAVTDPFTAPPIWFSQRKHNHFLIFSQRVADWCKRKNITEKQFTVFPYILDEKFSKPFADQQVVDTKIKRGFEPNKRILLLMGGGDGLPDGVKIAKLFLDLNLDIQMAMVCGKNKEQYESAIKLKEQYLDSNFTVLGFIDFAYEMMNISDIIITKGGPATVLEILLCKKVPVVSSYIWGQEKGNAEYVEINKVGIFEPNISKIPNRVKNLLNDSVVYNQYRDNIEKLNLVIGTKQVADFVYSYPKNSFHFV